MSNVLSGLHYGPGASLAAVVPYDFISDEPYLLSKRFHLNSINLSKLLWASAAELPSWVLVLLPQWLGVSAGLRWDPHSSEGSGACTCSRVLSMHPL